MAQDPLEEPHPGLLLVKPTADGLQRVAVAASAIASGAAVALYDGGGTVLDTPTMHTVALAPGRHVDADGAPAFVQHSCDPNTWIVAVSRAAGKLVPVTDPSQVAGLLLVARRAIAEGEGVTFDYCASEWAMSSPFDCDCGSKLCRGRVAGFASMAAAEQEVLLQLATPFVQAMATAAEEAKATAASRSATA